MTINRAIDEEIHWRRDLFAMIGSKPANYGIDPMLLREWNIYGGQQGIWVDKKRTGPLTQDGNGLAVSLLHKGNVYPDDFDETGIIYHYPTTNRPKSRDWGEIRAVKNCQELGVPVFVITVSPENALKRDVYFGYVTLYEDRAKAFIVEFGLDQRREVEPDAEKPFELKVAEARETYEASLRPNRAAFRIAVFRRYGLQCTVCGLSVIDLLDAAHLVPKSENGSDDPRNGLPLCVLHHRAFDKQFFAIEPQSYKVILKPNGPSASDLGIIRQDIEHLKAKPHLAALRYCWRKWQKQIGV